MGVIHIPKRKVEFGTGNVIENETTFLAFGGMAFTEQEQENKAFLVTLNHDTKGVQIAKLPNANLPGEGDTFRGNVRLFIDSYRLAMVGKNSIVGLDLSLPCNRMKWREID